MSVASPTDLLKLLVSAANDLQASRYTAVAALAIVLWDYLLTLPLEIKHIWGLKWRSVKILFFINRYPIIFIIAFAIYAWSGTVTWANNGRCRAWLWIQAITIITPVWTFNYTITLRVAVLWGRNQLLVNVLSVLITLATIYTIVMLAVVLSSMRYVANPLLAGCTMVNDIPWNWSIPLALVIYQHILFFLTIVRAFYHRGVTKNVPLLQVMYRDKFLYFAFMSALSLIIIIWPVIAGQTKILIIQYIGIGVFKATGDRLILDLLVEGNRNRKQSRLSLPTQLSVHWRSTHEPSPPPSATLVGNVDPKWPSSPKYQSGADAAFAETILLTEMDLPDGESIRENGRNSLEKRLKQAISGTYPPPGDHFGNAATAFDNMICVGRVDEFRDEKTNDAFDHVLVGVERSTTIMTSPGTVKDGDDPAASSGVDGVSVAS